MFAGRKSGSGVEEPYKRRDFFCGGMGRKAGAGAFRTADGGGGGEIPSVASGTCEG